MSIQYRYDELNRVVAAVYDNGQEISYAYDAAGNRMSVIVKGQSTPAHSSLQEPSLTFTEVTTPPEKLGQIKPPANTTRRPPPPEKL